MGPTAIRRRLARLGRRGRLRALALVLVLGAPLVVHHATMAMHEPATGAAAQSAAPGEPATGASLRPARGDADPAGSPHHAHGDRTPAASPHAPHDADATGSPGHAAGMAMSICLGVLGAVGAAVVAIRLGVVRLARERLAAIAPPAPLLAAPAVPPPRAGPAFLVLAVDRR